MNVDQLLEKIEELKAVVEKSEQAIKSANSAIEDAKREIKIYTTCLEVFQRDKAEEQERFATLCAQAAGDGAGVDNHRQYAIDRGLEFVWPEEEPETGQEAAEKPT